MKNLNLWGVLIATLVCYFFGFVWYGMLFEKSWTALSGITPEMAAKGGEAASMVFGLVNTAIAVFGLAWLIARTQTKGLAPGLITGLAVGAFFALTTRALGFIYAGGNVGLIPIDFGYLLILYGLAGAILAGVRVGRRHRA